MNLQPIGVIRSDLVARDEAPKQGSEGAPDAWLEVDARVADGLLGLAPPETSSSSSPGFIRRIGTSSGPTRGPTRAIRSRALSNLQRRLRRETCHILHFMGHGGFNPNTEDGLLLFSDEKGRGREVTGQELGTLLHDHRPLRLAVLNACEGARSSRSDPFAGVAQSLVRQGIPAVIAMQFEITDIAAINFAHELYAAVVDGYPVDAALAEARKAL